MHEDRKTTTLTWTYLGVLLRDELPLTSTERFRKYLRIMNATTDVS